MSWLPKADVLAVPCAPADMLPHAAGRHSAAQQGLATREHQGVPPCKADHQRRCSHQRTSQACTAWRSTARRASCGSRHPLTDDRPTAAACTARKREWSRRRRRKGAWSSSPLGSPPRTLRRVGRGEGITGGRLAAGVAGGGVCRQKSAGLGMSDCSRCPLVACAEQAQQQVLAAQGQGYVGKRVYSFRT